MSLTLNSNWKNLKDLVKFCNKIYRFDKDIYPTQNSLGSARWYKRTTSWSCTFMWNFLKTY